MLDGKAPLSGIIENTIKKFRQLNSKIKFAAIGPCIEIKVMRLNQIFIKNLFLNRKGMIFIL